MDRDGEAHLPEEVLDALWSQVESNWNDPNAHRRFIGASTESGRLGDACSRYRKVKDSDLERRPEAERKLAELLFLASQALSVAERQESKPRGSRSRVTVILLGFVAAIASWMVLRLVFRQR